jgi:hypothetical protein
MCRAVGAPGPDDLPLPDLAHFVDRNWSVDAIIGTAELRPRIIEAVERGTRR